MWRGASRHSSTERFTHIIVRAPAEDTLLISSPYVPCLMSFHRKSPEYLKIEIINDFFQEYESDASIDEEYHRRALGHVDGLSPS